jgi:hypothetical protein
VINGKKKPSGEGRLVIYFEHTHTLHTFRLRKLFLCMFCMCDDHH